MVVDLFLFVPCVAMTPSEFWSNDVKFAKSSRPCQSFRPSKDQRTPRPQGPSELVRSHQAGHRNVCKLLMARGKRSAGGFLELLFGLGYEGMRWPMGFLWVYFRKVGTNLGWQADHQVIWITSLLFKQVGWNCEGSSDTTKPKGTMPYRMLGQVNKTLYKSTQIQSSNSILYIY